MEKWNKKIVSNQEEFNSLLVELENDNPKYIGLDTETTGLNITTDKAFLIIVGWDNKVFTFDLTSGISTNSIQSMYNLMSRATYVFCWNTKFDLHMLANAGIPYNSDNLSDGTILARIKEPVESRSLKLKTMTSKYVKDYKEEKKDLISNFIKEIKGPRVRELTQQLKPYKFSYGEINKALKDPLLGFDSLPEQVKTVYVDWCKRYNHKNYYEDYKPSYLEVYNLKPELMREYAFYDVIHMMEFITGEHNSGKKNFLERVLSVREGNVFIRESKVIRPLWVQERNGWKIDVDYLKVSIEKIKKVIKEKRIHLSKLAGKEISANQHLVIREIIFKRINPSSFPIKDALKMIKTEEHGFEIFLPLKTKWDHLKSNKESLQKINETTTDPFLKEFISLILEVRRLEDWYGKYLIGILRNSLNSDKGIIRTSYNSTGTITGRLSSDFQQFPREGIIVDDKELFHPRKLIIPYGGEYPSIYFFDYSQIELRFQAEYTYKIKKPDVNLIKAFINLDNEPDWTPTDLHGLNVITAFNIDETHPDFKTLRNGGKTINFAVTYGSGLKGLLKNNNLRKFSEEQITNLFNAYNTNFPGILKFRESVRHYIQKYSFIHNLYDRRYLFKEKKHSYMAGNYLIQGSSADFLKEKMIKCYDFINHNNLKTKMIGNIHDEIQFAIPKKEEHLVSKFKEIMEESTTQIPIVVDVEKTTTNWAEKEEVI